jgi:hypothetical protein
MGDNWKIRELMMRYTDRVPVIVKKYKHPETGMKFLVPNDMTLSSFITLMRKKNQLAPTQSIFVFAGDKKLLSFTDTIRSLYDQHKDKEDILVLTYAYENVFG